MDFQLCLGLFDTTLRPDASEASLACYGTFLLSLSESVMRYTARKRNAALCCRPRAPPSRRIRRCKRSTVSSRGHHLRPRLATWMSAHSSDYGCRARLRRQEDGALHGKDTRT